MKAHGIFGLSHNMLTFDAPVISTGATNGPVLLAAHLTVSGFMHAIRALMVSVHMIRQIVVV